MGTEYYIIKPATKQKFYLGRRISHLQGIPDATYKKEPDWCTWEYYGEVFTDIQENSPYFLEGDLVLSQIWNFCSAIFEFCDDKVLLDNDCSNTFSQYNDYEEVDLYSDILTKEEQWCELINLVPREFWVVDGHIIKEYETVCGYLEKIKNGGFRNERDNNNEERYN